MPTIEQNLRAVLLLHFEQILVIGMNCSDNSLAHTMDNVFAQFEAVTVRVVPFKVMHVPLQLQSGVSSLLGDLTKRFLVKEITLEPTRAMLRPGTLADPTPLVAASRAGHVIAPLVFFDVYLAFRARFGVRNDPIRSF